MDQALRSRRPTSDIAILRGHPSSPALKQEERALGAIATLAGYGVVAPNDLAHTLKAIEEGTRSIAPWLTCSSATPKPCSVAKGDRREPSAFRYSHANPPDQPGAMMTAESTIRFTRCGGDVPAE